MTQRPDQFHSLTRSEIETTNTARRAMPREK
jgi:hypothetical protein